ncbi:MAG TPA: DUF4340 domain-containing protein [Polyangia bacterium]|nr:DUF4340 domain-containing protein [Polyangia bacterium]
MRRVGVLAAIAALLALVLLLDRRHAPEEAGAARRLLPDFDRASVSLVSIGRGEGAGYALERRPAGQEPAWVVKPGDAPADTAAVEELLGALEAAETTRTATLSDAAAGLAPPRVRVALGRDGSAGTILLGREATGGGVFAKAPLSPEIRVAPRRLLALADRDASAFRDRRLIPLAAGDVARITWQEAGGGAHHLARDGARWRDEAAGLVAAARVEEAAHRLLDLRAVRFVPAAAPIGPPSRIEVVAASGAVTSFQIGGGACGAAERLVAPSAGEASCVAGSELDAAFRALDAAREPDRRLVSSPPAEVERVELREGPARLSLVRSSPTSWRLEAPHADTLVDPRAIDDWLAALGRIDTGPRSGARGPHVRHLVVTGRAGTDEADVGPGEPGYALVALDPLRFRDRAVLDFAHFDARTLRRTAGGRTVQLASVDGESWRAVAPSGADVDQQNVARVVGALGNLRAEAFLAKPPAGSSAATLEVAVQPPGEASPSAHTIEVYKTKEAPGCAGRLDRETSFTLAAAACAELLLPLTK